MEYLQMLRLSRPLTHSQRRAAHPPASPATPPHEDQLPVLESAARALADLAGVTSSARSARGESWYRIPITPDIELSVRGEFGTEQLAQLHRIGDALRNLLTKGPSK